MSVFISQKFYQLLGYVKMYQNINSTGTRNLKLVKVTYNFVYFVTKHSQILMFEHLFHS